MKAILLAAAALVAVPAIAQTDPAASGVAAPQTTTAPPAEGTDMAPAGDTMQTPAPTDTTQTPPADPSMGGQMTPPAGTTDGTAPMSAPMASGDGSAADPAGGYQPSAPAIQGAAAPGATVRFQPAADPNTAYPPPPPLKSYPVCKKGQYDNCRNPGGR